MDELATRRLILLFLIVIIVIIIIVLVLAYRYVPASTTSSSTTGCQSVSPPSNISATAENVTDIKVTWNAINGAVRYTVYIGTVPGFTKATALNTYNAISTEYTITGMIVGRTYYIMLDSVNACSNSSVLSGQISVFLGFPSKFKIISRAEPSFALKIAPDFSNIVIDNICTGVGLDNLCVWEYDSDNALIKSVSAPTNCIKTFPKDIDVRVKYGNCEVFLYPNSASARQWNYNAGSLCNPLNSEGLNCIKIGGVPFAGQNTIAVPFDGGDDMRWTIEAVE